MIQNSRAPLSLLLTFVLIILCTFASWAADRVTFYTAWDDGFLYVAAEVQDRDIASTNTKHMSNPWEDDAIEIFLETDNQRAAKRTSSTYQMSVSAGGGSSWQIGDGGAAKPKPIYSFKYAKKLQGTPNNPNDRDIGYVIELAMPWKEMGGPPTSRQMMGFNLVCRVKGENDTFVSFSPDVKTADDIQSPAKWKSLRFVTTPTVILTQDGALVCRKVISRAPVVDGNLSPGEWNRDMSVQINLPEPPQVAPRQRYLIEKLALTHYFYWYQGDERKEAPFSHVRYEDGSSMLTDQPLRGAGPWLSYDQVQWHKDELSDIRRANIDVVLPVYWGDTTEKRGFASKGLNCLVQALKELKTEKKDYPLVGMFFDTSAMAQQYGQQGKPDLKNPEVQETFYGMLKDFFLHVPEEFRAVVQIPPDRGGYPAYIAVLYTASSFSDLDKSFVEYCNKRFAQDFGGSRLIWIGSSDYRPKAAVMDGYTDYGAGRGLKYDDTGWISVAGIGAGYDDSAVRGRTTPIRARVDGDAYRKDWNAVVAKAPDWIVVDGWNELHEGSDICASRQYGVKYVGLTKINMLRFNGMRQFDAKFVKHNTPSVMLPGAMYQISVTVRNVGTKPWYAGQGYYLACRWYKDGRLYADNGARLPLQAVVLAGQSAEKTMGILVADQTGNPLPEGDYELRWEMVGTRDAWFSAGGDMPLCIPVKVGKPAQPGFTVLSSTMPTMAKSGGTYKVTLKIRNDGPAAWKASDAKIGYRWHRSSVHLGTDSEDSAGMISANESAAALPADVEPGRVAEVTVPVSVVAADGSQLPVWTQNDLWTYMLKWDVFDGEKWLADQGIGCGSEAVAVTSTDCGVRFVESDTPKELPAGKKTSVNLTLVNTSPEIWKAAELSVGYHWYFLDGTEAVWNGERSKLSKDVKPGELTSVKASVTAPAFDGQYYLVWDMVNGDTWTSTTSNTRGGSTLVIPVKVAKGSLVALDLTKLLDADISSFDSYRGNGDFDGKGGTFPADLLPPDASQVSPSADLWPCGYYLPAQGKGLESPRHISFKYPSKVDGEKNAVACKGQSIEVKRGRYSAIHILAASSEDAEGEVVLSYGPQSATRKVSFSPWNEAPRHGEHAAFVCLHRHTPSGDERGQACYLNHYTVEADPAQELTAIKLPTSGTVKILAITVEKAEGK